MQSQSKVTAALGLSHFATELLHCAARAQWTVPVQTLPIHSSYKTLEISTDLATYLSSLSSLSSLSIKSFKPRLGWLYPDSAGRLVGRNLVHELYGDPSSLRVAPRHWYMEVSMNFQWGLPQ